MVAVEFVHTVETAVAERAPTLALPRKRERGQEKPAGKQSS
jgi:hypothetical protein